MSNSDRRDLLNKIADNIEKQSHEIAEIESTDNGKPFGMALHDIKFSTEILRYYAGWTDKKHGQTIPMQGDYLSFTQQVPVGVCG